MATIRERRALRISARDAWAQLANVGEVHRLVSFLDGARVEDDTRVCSIAEDAPFPGELVETILAVDDGLRRVAYSVTASPFGIAAHAASMEIVDEEGGATLVWTTDVKPDEVAAQLKPVIAQEIDHIALRLDAGAAR
ncbi:MAG: SRPBCC family protein [Myxococcota bacterium]